MYLFFNNSNYPINFNNKYLNQQYVLIYIFCLKQKNTLDETTYRLNKFKNKLQK